MNTEKKFNNLSYLWYLLSVAVLIFDLVTKSLTDGKSHQAIPGVFKVSSFHNTGASFSMFSGVSGAQYVFIVLGIAVCFALIFYSIKSKRKQNFNAWFFIGISLLIAGILGNVIDRIFLGYVRDFIMLEFMNFAVFNVADSSLCVGAVVFAIWLIFFSMRVDKGKENGNKDF